MDLPSIFSDEYLFIYNPNMKVIHEVERGGESRNITNIIHLILIFTNFSEEILYPVFLLYSLKTYNQVIFNIIYSMIYQKIV